VTGFPGSPKLIKGGIVLLDATNGELQGVIGMQYDPDTLTRSFQVQGVGDGGFDDFKFRSWALGAMGCKLEITKGLSKPGKADFKVAPRRWVVEAIPPVRCCFGIKKPVRCCFSGKKVRLGIKNERLHGWVGIGV
jgi:hypothetical protein